MKGVWGKLFLQKKFSPRSSRKGADTIKIIDRIENKYLRIFCDWLVAIAILLIVFFVLQAFVVKPAVISGASMEPTLLHEDRVLISRFYYMFTDPTYGDVIAFPYRSDPSKCYVKRIVGIAGDIIDIEDYRFTVNGELLEDDFTEEAIVSLGDVEFPLTVPEDSYFVLGDNRNRSNDSRYKSVGCIKRSEILGKIQVRIWPINKIGLI